MTRRRARLALGLALVLAAVAALALLAGASFRVEGALSAGAPPRERGVAFRSAEWLLGAADDREAAEAFALFDAVRVDGLDPEDAIARHGEAEAALGRVVESQAPAAARSRAATLNGILLAEDARLDPRSAGRYLELALQSFREAVTLDPDNEAAKANLELLVRLLREQREDVRGRSGDIGDSGAASRPEGSGY